MILQAVSSLAPVDRLVCHGRSASARLFQGRGPSCNQDDQEEHEGIRERIVGYYLLGSIL